ncbi:MAG TPA: hypothetical protein DET40_17725 [Lentisphaeria bacterium]|nr:MAG: hypothetical protein A2X45_02280 [Lentisphaerae bacterium GWF2_50_93]HCE45382.1 hypothetical protein [Lentisphaeria bacterium]
MNQLVKWKYFPHFLLVVITSAVYSYSMPFPLLEGWDDHIYVTCNVEKLAPCAANLIYWLSHPCEGCYLPLTMFSYMFDHAVWGLNGFGYHLQNVFWHILAVLAVFSCMKYFRISLWLAFGLSLAFSVHPQRVESVVWISERKDVMCTALYFWSIFFWFTEKNKRFTIISFILFILALFSKSMAVSLPFVLLACEFYGQKKFDMKSWSRKLWPFFLILLVFIPITIFSQDINKGGISIGRQCTVLIHNIAWYVGANFIPRDLSPIYPRLVLDTAVIFKIVAIYALILFIGVLFLKRDRRYFINDIVPLAFCFIVSIGPVAGFLPLGAIDYADRYSYIPSVFLWIIFGSVASYVIGMKLPFFENHLKFWKICALGFTAYYVIYLIIINLIYSNSWKSYDSVLRTACSYDPPSYMALGALADIELSEGNFKEAVKTADTIILRRKGLETEKGYHQIILKAKYTKAFASYNIGNKKESLKIFEEIKPDLNVDSFGSASGYNSMLKMMIDCCNSLGDKEKAGKLKLEIKK